MDYTALVPTPARNKINPGYSPLNPATMIQVFGTFPSLPVDCGKTKNPKVAKLLTTRDVGPFPVTGIEPAVHSLEVIFAEINRDHPELLAMLDTAGMNCYRRVRGSDGVPSVHAAGCAIDMKVRKYLPPFNATKVPYGFTVMYKYFHNHGWFWAAGYHGRTDPMHFEWAKETLLAFHSKGIV